MIGQTCVLSRKFQAISSPLKYYIYYIQNGLRCYLKKYVLLLISVINPTPGPLVINNCDFESNLCGYVNDKSGDNFDWTRQTGRTASSNTGPSSDHTLGTNSGKICTVFEIYFLYSIYAGIFILSLYGEVENIE